MSGPNKKIKQEDQRGKRTILFQSVSSALYERAVGFYASLVNINAYHQPGVEAGKKATTRVLQLQKRVTQRLSVGPEKTAKEIAQSLEADPEDVFHILQHLAANDPAIRVSGDATIGSRKYSSAR